MFLCKLCENIIKDQITLKESFIHVTFVHNLARSFPVGCDFSHICLGLTKVEYVLIRRDVMMPLKLKLV